MLGESLKEVQDFFSLFGCHSNHDIVSIKTLQLKTEVFLKTCLLSDGIFNCTLHGTFLGKSTGVKTH